MTVTELQRLLRAQDPAAVLVSPRVLERVIQQAYNLPGLAWTVPHRKSFVVDRHVLFRHVEQDDLHLETDQLLPPTVILLAEPAPEEIHGQQPGPILLRYWKRLFHASVHLRLQELCAAGGLTQADVRARIDRLGQTEFEEIRTVLTQDGFLPPRADERTVYIEFAAVFLEMRYFTPNLLQVSFPGVCDLDRAEQMLAQDVDAAALFEKTRLQGAPSPVVRTTSSSDEAHEFYWKLVRSAERAAQSGNVVKAAIQRTRAARVAPAAFSPGTRADAEADIRRLTQRLVLALQLSDAEAEALQGDLVKLLDKADQGRQPVEAALLFDLQKVCLDHEKDIYALDLVEYLLSAGKRPVKRPLPGQKLVRVYGHLRSAVGRLTMARLADADRQRLADLLQRALTGAEERLRARFRPSLIAVLEDVGFNPRTPPERTAFLKVVEELLDRIKEYGFLTFGDLRDTVSRNQLKLPDLADPEEFVRGDALLRMDRRLGTLMDGVYRPSEIYMRLLERMTALNFGTATGRLLTRWVTIPFLGAFLILEAVKHVLQMVGGPDLPTMTLFLAMLLPGGGDLEVSQSGAPLAKSGQAVAAARTGDVVAFAAKPGPEANGLPAAAARPAPRQLVAPSESKRTLPPPTGPPAAALATAAGSFLLLSFFLMGLLHSSDLRRRLGEVLRGFYRPVRRLVIEVPRAVLHVPWLRRAATSWPMQLSVWYVFKPLLFSALIWLVIPVTRSNWIAALSTFAAVNILLNSRPGQAAGDAVISGLVGFWHLLRAGLIPGLVHWVLRQFKRITQAVEYVLFSVDEWLRFRRGDSRFSMVVRTLLGVVWFPISYVTRFYVLVLIEPGLNPIKFPISSLAAKIVYPFTLSNPALIEALARPLTPLVGEFLSTGFVLFTLFWLPDAFTFFIWEMKENWKLYKANRPAAVRPVAVGGHGETVRRLLQRGFHSGTVPKLFAKLRAAERTAYASGNWRLARTYRLRLDETAEAVKRFVERELVTLLEESEVWEGEHLNVGRVSLATNALRVELVHAGFPADPIWLEVETRSGWMVAGLAERGWLGKLPREQACTLMAGLAYLYKVAGVDLVREQVRAALPASVASYDLTPNRLVLWLDQRHGMSILYDLRDPTGQMEPLTPAGTPAPGWPVLDKWRVVFSTVPLYWSDWEQVWQREREGCPRLLNTELDLSLLGPAAPRLTGTNGVLAPANLRADRPSSARAEDV